MLQPVAVLGTGEPGSRPGRHFFMSRGGRHEQLKKYSVPRSFSIFYFDSIIGNGALLAEKVPCAEAMSRGSPD